MIFKKYKLYTLEELKNKYHLEIYSNKVHLDHLGIFEFIENLGKKIYLIPTEEKNWDNHATKYIDKNGITYWSPFIKLSENEELE